MNQVDNTMAKDINILLIDDSDVDNFINKAIISKEDNISQITTMSSGREALAHLKHIIATTDVYPDIIFLDIKMPGMSGFEFLDEYITLPNDLTNHCKVYILSSSMDNLDSEKGKEYSVVKKHLTKPLAHHAISNLLNDD
ncbi:response regulator [Maribacter ulvicola]|uniref:Response regulator receiver domain-containing protein n=1 Tax=Maribacter ulvicola TaxID=228959 RepID=A0A1N6PFJ1_9FLAO|nr:response regulator [Maribacter ulvicola]SIQ02982.1 Response regulator receiver domain-containing protein [Maribacter ulvicola]